MFILLQRISLIFLLLLFIRGINHLEVTGINRVAKTRVVAKTIITTDGTDEVITNEIVISKRSIPDNTEQFLVEYFQQSGWELQEE